MTTAPDLPSAPTTLTYPISPDYVRAGHGGTGWTPVRALAEFIANALDEDPQARVTWAEGALTIEDEGPGIPEEGLLLGYSPKDDSQIGQFGEGSKIGALVLARSPEVGAISIETVGYGFVPSVESRRILDGVAPRRTAEAPEVLVYTFLPSARERGTRVTVEVAEELAREAMSRFRHLAESGYTPPTTSEVITSGKRGRLFIGGVLVTELPRLRASYDFPLTSAKTAQNRDRSVIATETLNELVQEALAAAADPGVIQSFVDHVLAGRPLAEAERYFAHVTDPRVRAAFAAEGRRRFEGEEVFFCNPGEEATVALLADFTATLVTSSLPGCDHVALMRLLGVQPAPRAAEKIARDTAKATTYVPLSTLSEEESATLRTAREKITALFGRDAVGPVKVYTTTSRQMACARGFYDPATGSISLQRAVLASAWDALEVLLHEVAHRLAHRRGDEYADRTRGFDRQLGAMLAHAVTAHADAAEELSTLSSTPGAPVSAPLAPPPDAAPAASAPLPAAGAVAPATSATVTAVPPAVVAAVPASRTLLAEILTADLPGACLRLGIDPTSGPKFMRQIGLHEGTWDLLIRPRVSGWRRAKGAMSPSVLVDFRAHEVLGAAFDVPPALSWLAHMLCEADVYARRSGAPVGGPWAPRARAEAERAASSLASWAGTLSSPEQSAALAAAAELRLRAETGVVGAALDEAFVVSHLGPLLAAARLAATASAAAAPAAVVA